MYARVVPWSPAPAARSYGKVRGVGSAVVVVRHNPAWRLWMLRFGQREVDEAAAAALQLRARLVDISAGGHALAARAARDASL